MVSKKQTNVRLSDELKINIKVLVAQNPQKWKSISDFMEEAAIEKLHKEGKK